MARQPSWRQARISSRVTGRMVPESRKAKACRISARRSAARQRREPGGRQLPARDHHLLTGLDPSGQLREAGLGLADQAPGLLVSDNRYLFDGQSAVETCSDARAAAVAALPVARAPARCRAAASLGVSTVSFSVDQGRDHEQESSSGEGRRQSYARPGTEDGLREVCRNRSTTISCSPA
jgi:hypothetical protein